MEALKIFGATFFLLFSDFNVMLYKKNVYFNIMKNSVHVDDHTVFAYI